MRIQREKARAAHATWAQFQINVQHLSAYCVGARHSQWHQPNPCHGIIRPRELQVSISIEWSTSPELGVLFLNLLLPSPYAAAISRGLHLT